MMLDGSWMLTPCDSLLQWLCSLEQDERHVCSESTVFSRTGKTDIMVHHVFADVILRRNYTPMVICERCSELHIYLRGQRQLSMLPVVLQIVYHSHARTSDVLLSTCLGYPNHGSCGSSAKHWKHHIFRSTRIWITACQRLCETCLTVFNTFSGYSWRAQIYVHELSPITRRPGQLVPKAPESSYCEAR
jgi:hypothetical protein